MESKNIKENAIKTNGNLELKPSGTSEEFQVFITNLFEKNGVLNDLRAYLRGHIVTFLRSVENGDMPETQKHFTQRLQFKFQAINAVIAEYLMKLNFGYSCSVFTSEIPLANMVFDFTNNLFENSLNDNNLQFSANDIFQILNYLGMRCDKEHIMRILEDYQKHDEPLLMCILKNASLYGNLVCNVDEDSLSINSHNKKNNHQLKCNHYAYCELCQNYLSLKKEKYKKRKKNMAERGLKYPLNNPNVKNMATKIKVIEKKLIEEMFEQLKNVYEGEIEILREENEKKVRRSLANHASLMQKHRLEAGKLEKEIESRWITMEAEFRERKHFVAGLGATLKDAHEKLRDARRKLKKDTEDLVIRENSLKFQLQKAEETLNVKGEELQTQILHELMLLNEQHQNLKKEKNALVNERQELENLKKLHETNFKLMTSFNIQERDNLVMQYDAMKNELDELKKYVASSNESKSNQDTVVKSNNNEMIHDNDDRVKVNHVVNDLKKLKNVNFCQSKCDGTCLDTLKRLREEHEKIQEFSKQQSSHIELLSLSLRQINQAASTCTTTQSVPRQIFQKEKSGENILNHDVAHVPPKSTYLGNASTNEIRDVWNTSQRTANIESQGITLKASSQKTLREAGDALWKKNKKPVAEGDKNSNIITREAKLRLRKLEIEAEAVERSYLKFRQRRAQENRLLLKEEKNVKTPKTDTKENFKRNSQRENQRQRHTDEDETANKCSYEKIYQQTNLDFDKYLRKYHDDEKTTVSLKKCNKIEHKYNKDEERKGEWHSFNYLETPLIEFRKLYQSRSRTHRATNKSTHEKLYKRDSDDIPNKNFDLHGPSTRLQIKSKEDQNINALSESLIDNLNTTPQTKIGDMHIKDNVEVSFNVQTTEFKIPNTTKESENDEDPNNIVGNTDKNKYYNIVKTNHDDLYEMYKELTIETTKISKSDVDQKSYTVEFDNMTEPYKNETIVEITGDVQKISTEDSVGIISEDNNKSENKIYLKMKVLAEEHINGSFDESTRDIKKNRIKETTDALTEEILEENGTNIVNEDSLASGASNYLSDRKTNLDILEKSSDIVVKHLANAETGNVNDVNRLTEIDKHINITPGQMTHVNDSNEILSKSVSLKENLKINNTEESKSVSPKENLNINNTEELNEHNSKEIEKHSEAEYEDDFSIPIIEDSLSENNNNFPISILKSSEEENFWD